MTTCPASGCSHEERPQPGDSHAFPLVPQHARLLEHVESCPHVAEDIQRITEGE